MSLIPCEVASTVAIKNYEEGTICWNNKTLQSVRFCRPLKMEFAKESKDHILKEKEDLNTQVKKLSSLFGDNFN